MDELRVSYADIQLLRCMLLHRWNGIMLTGLVEEVCCVQRCSCTCVCVCVCVCACVCVCVCVSSDPSPPTTAGRPRHASAPPRLPQTAPAADRTPAAAEGDRNNPHTPPSSADLIETHECVRTRTSVCVCVCVCEDMDQRVCVCVCVCVRTLCVCVFTWFGLSLRCQPHRFILKQHENTLQHTKKRSYWWLHK